jgi:DNA-binding MarR family transcriptional regulator
MVVQPRLSITPHLDVGHLGTFLGQLYEQAVFAKLERLGFKDVKRVHGYVVQRLISGSSTASAMAADIGVTQQAVSKWVAELMSLGLVVVAPGEGDARQRRVQLSARGRQCVRASREARAKVTKQLLDAVGAKRVEKTKDELLALLQVLGGLQAIAERRVQVPREI